MLATQRSAPRQRWLILGIGLGAWTITFNISSVNLALPTLIEALGADIATAQWVALSYTLTIAGLGLGVARLGDIYSKKQLYGIGVAIFALGTALCGLAPTIAWLTGFRFLQGLGAVFVSTMGIALLAETFRKRQRGRALGIVIGFTSLGIAMGPPIGGALIAVGSWRWIFGASVPIGLIARRLVRAVTPSTESQQKESQQKKGSFDGWGVCVWIVT